jgi:hypothetical protein
LSSDVVFAGARREEAGVKAGRRPPGGLGLDAGEERRMLHSERSRLQLVVVFSP